MRQRKPYARDDRYLEYVASMDCLACHKNGLSDPAHVKSRGAGGRDRGNTVPLCRAHHTEQHTIGIKSFELQYNLSLKTEAKRIGKAYVALEVPF